MGGLRGWSKCGVRGIDVVVTERKSRSISGTEESFIRKCT